MSKSSLCDYSDAYIVVNETISVAQEINHIMYVKK